MTTPGSIGKAASQTTPIDENSSLFEALTSSHPLRGLESQRRKLANSDLSNGISSEGQDPSEAEGGDEPDESVKAALLAKVRSAPGYRAEDHERTVKRLLQLALAQGGPKEDFVEAFRNLPEQEKGEILRLLDTPESSLPDPDGELGTEG